MNNAQLKKWKEYNNKIRAYNRSQYAERDLRYEEREAAYQQEHDEWKRLPWWKRMFVTEPHRYWHSVWHREFPVFTIEATLEDFYSSLAKEGSN